MPIRWSILIVALLSAMCASSLPASPDSPPRAPADYKEFSPNHKFYMTSQVKAHLTQVFQTGKPATPLWQLPFYINIPALSDDGCHIAVIYEGANILEFNARPSDALITFFNADNTHRVVTVGDVIPDLKALPRSTSGLDWGYPTRFLPNGRLQVILEDRRIITLDPEPQKP